MKKISLLSLMASFFILTSCSIFKDQTFYYCPYIKIPRNTAYLSQINNKFDNFQIQVTGFEGYCYFDNNIKSYKASITPIFEVSRLSPSKDTALDFKFFVETQVGPPEFLGMWTHTQSASIPLTARQTTIKGKTIEQRIPSTDQDKFEINLGLTQTNDEKNFNNKTFDIQFDYVEKR